jgi:hypothetical protein
MNRRSIFKILASATLAAAIEVTGLVPTVRKLVTRVMANPAYYTAECEALVFWDTVKKEGSLVVIRGVAAAKAAEEEWVKKHGGVSDPDGVALVPDHCRQRYNFVDGKYVEVPFYLTYEEEVPV